MSKSLTILASLLLIFAIAVFIGWKLGLITFYSYTIKK